MIKSLFLAALVLATPALADSDMDMMKLANGLGSVLASEEPCHLAYDQSAIQAFIAKKADPENLTFAPMLNTMTTGIGLQIADMSPSALTAHCAAITRTAVAYGFIAPPTR